MSTRRRPWGSVHYDRERQCWRARAGDAERTSLGRYASEAEALDALAEAHRYARLASGGPSTRGTLLAFGRRWLDDEERAGLRRGVDRERARFECHLAAAPFAEWPLATVTRADVQRWVRDIAAAPAEGARGGGRRSMRTVARALSLLRVILGAAMEDGLLDASPAEGIRLPRHEATGTLTLLSAAEVELLRTCDAIPTRARAAFLVAAYAGLRPGEMWGLRWSDVQLGGSACVTVSRSRGRGTKTGEARRVPLLEPARDALERWASEQGRLRGLVWPGEDGAHHAAGYDAGWSDRPQTLAQLARVRRAYPGVEHPARRYVALGYRWRAGILTRLPLADLRHTCASHLLRGTWVARGWIGRPLRMEEVSQWLGHSSVTTTERHYAELEPGGLLDVVPATRAHVRAVEGEAWKTHELKTWPLYFDQIEAGAKLFEVRRNDRGYAVGHELRLRCWSPGSGYDGRTITARVTSVLRGGSFGIEPGHVVMGIRPIRSAWCSDGAITEQTGESTDPMTDPDPDHEEA